MSQADLETRVERLETALAELQIIVMKGQAKSLPYVEERRTSSQLVETDDASWLALSGISLLIFGGAYLLRALTESSILPRAGGIALGLTYALVWIIFSDRAARAGRKRNAAFYAGTAAAIAFPLVWETTTQFKYVSPAAGGACAALIGVILLFVAWHNDEQAIAWIGSIGSILVTIAIVTPDGILPLMISGSVVGAATLRVAILMGWKFVALPAVVLTNSLAAMTVGMPLLRGKIETPGEIIAALTAFAAVWLAIIFWKERLGFFDIIESGLLLAIGAGGAAIIAGVSHQYSVPLAFMYAALGVAAFFSQRRWLVWVALYLITLAALLTVDIRLAAGIVALTAFGAMWRKDGFHDALLTISILVLFLIAGEGKGPLIRTCALAAIAAALALASRLTVARIILVVGALKLLGEDVRLESAAMLVISFASYGLAMLTVARCVRRHTSDVHESPISPPDDTFSRTPGDQTV